MLRTILFCLAFAVSPAATATAQDSRDPAIESVISDQMQAFRDTDLATAFSFAAPGIQQMFGTPENFGLMVEQGYPMVWQPGEVTFGELRTVDGQLWQEVFVRDAAGATHALAYEMREIGGTWRIGGVRILPKSDVAV